MVNSLGPERVLAKRQLQAMEVSLAPPSRMACPEVHSLQRERDSPPPGWLLARLGHVSRYSTNPGPLSFFPAPLDDQTDNHEAHFGDRPISARYPILHHQHA